MASAPSLRRRTVREEAKADVHAEAITSTDADARLYSGEMQTHEFNRIWKQGLTILSVLAGAVYLALVLRRSHQIVTMFHVSSLFAACLCFTWLSTGNRQWRSSFAAMVGVQWWVLVILYLTGQPASILYKCIPTATVLLVITVSSTEFMRYSEAVHAAERKRVEERINEEMDKRLN